MIDKIENRKLNNDMFGKGKSWFYLLQVSKVVQFSISSCGLWYDSTIHKAQRAVQWVLLITIDLVYQKKM